MQIQIDLEGVDLRKKADQVLKEPSEGSSPGDPILAVPNFVLIGFEVSSVPQLHSDGARRIHVFDGEWPPRSYNGPARSPRARPVMFPASVDAQRGWTRVLSLRCGLGVVSYQFDKARPSAWTDGLKQATTQGFRHRSGSALCHPAMQNV